MNPAMEWLIINFIYIQKIKKSIIFFLSFFIYFLHKKSMS